MSNDEGARTVSKRQIARLIGGSSLAMYVLSEDDVVVFANDAVESWLGVPNDSIVGVSCSFLLDPSEQSPKEPPSPSAPASLTSKGDIRVRLAAPIRWDRRNVLITPDSDGVHVRYWIPLDSQKDSKANESAVVLCIVTEESARKASQRFDPNALDVQHNSAIQMREVPIRDLWFLAGKSLAIDAARKQVNAVSRTSSSFIIQGAVGSEREQLAKSIHRTRIDETKSLNTPSLVCIECRLMDSQLLETMFEVIDETIQQFGEKSTVLLAGLDQLDVELLLSLERYMSRTPKITAIATMESSKREECEKSESWRRLHYRIGHQFVVLPTLQSRLEDLESLVNAWFQQSQKQRERQLRITGETTRPHYSFEEGFLDALQSYPWLGDHAELSSVLEHTLHRSEDGVFRKENLPISVRTAASHINRNETWEAIDLDRILESVEKKLTLETLEKCKGNRSAAAKLLNISRARLIRRLQSWGIVTEGSETPIDDLPQFEEID